MTTEKSNAPARNVPKTSVDPAFSWPNTTIGTTVANAVWLTWSKATSKRLVWSQGHERCGGTSPRAHRRAVPVLGAAGILFIAMEVNTRVSSMMSRDSVELLAARNYTRTNKLSNPAFFCCQISWRNRCHRQVLRKPPWSDSILGVSPRCTCVRDIVFSL